MRRFSKELVFAVVLCLFGHKPLFAAAYDGRDDFQVPVQAGGNPLLASAHSLVMPSCCRLDTTDTLHRL
jgi:hypothetical protein